MKVLAKDGNISQVFGRGTGRSLEAGLFMSELLSDQRLEGEMVRHGLELAMCLSPPSSDDFVRQRATSALREHVERDRPLCIVMSPTRSRLLDLAVEIATAQLQNNKQFVLRSIR